MYIICDVVLWFSVIHLLVFLLRVVCFVFENIRHVGVGIVSLFSGVFVRAFSHGFLLTS